MATKTHPKSKALLFVGFDNGVSSQGIGVIDSDRKAQVIKLPIKNELSYTKEAKHINRIDQPALLAALKVLEDTYEKENIFVGLERPMVNPLRFLATMSAMRALEATLITLETLGWSHRYLDSKEWQKVMLPSGLKGAPALKKASLDVGIRTFPSLNLTGDADGILMAEFMRREHQK